MTERRELLKLLVASGVFGHGAAAAMQEDTKLTTEILERAATAQRNEATFRIFSL